MLVTDDYIKQMRLQPYTQVHNSDGTYIRVFEEDVDESELVWHRDHHDRSISVITGKGWKFQFDDELPRDINSVKYIPKGTYHRIIKGEGKLVLQIRDMK